jgi:phage terminase Nu1 subunit (DNA packaging protein)
VSETDDTAGTIATDVAARLLMLEPSEFAGVARAGWFKIAAKGRYRLVEVVQGYLKSLTHEIERGRTAAEAAVHLDISTRGFLELVERGIIPRPAKANYDLAECRKLYIRQLRGVASGHGDGAAGASLTSERALLAKEQRETITLKNAISRGDFVSLTLIQKALMVIFSVIRERLLTIPGKLADALAMRNRDEIEAILRGEITEALDELHDPTTNVAGSGDRGDDQGSAGDPAPAAKSQPDRVG